MEKERRGPEGILYLRLKVNLGDRGVEKMLEKCISLNAN